MHGQDMRSATYKQTDQSKQAECIICMATGFGLHACEKPCSIRPAKLRVQQSSDKTCSYTKGKLYRMSIIQVIEKHLTVELRLDKTHLLCLHIYIADEGFIHLCNTTIKNCAQEHQHTAHTQQICLAALAQQMSDNKHLPVHVYLSVSVNSASTTLSPPSFLSAPGAPSGPGAPASPCCA